MITGRSSTRSGRGTGRCGFNSMPKYLVSSTLTDPEWNNSTVTGGDLEVL
jgi:hypothetical protein